MIWTCQPAPCHSRLMRELRACRLQMLPFAGISGFRVVVRNDSGGDYSQSPCTRYELQMGTGGEMFYSQDSVSRYISTISAVR